ncbi:hypothetical protein DSO57_1015882 [Entomophthora muscae]|uniref:Uncharacterized protein n=1 Tax=Entomophthora muscae TaxID=34485 RepID=A0ACC2RJK1_9FUNG|nr:hypothetical protein DSO57_1015882 [Entomophthora muscae]
MRIPSSRSLAMIQDTLWGLVDRNPTLYLFTMQDFLQLSLVHHKEVLDLLDQFSAIFAKDSTDYVLAKGVIHQINTGDASPFCAKPYCCSCVEDVQVSKEIKQLLNAGLLAPSQSPWASPCSY